MIAGILAGAAIGGLAGPALARLSVGIPAGTPIRQLVRGPQASAGRIWSMTGASVAVCALLGARIGLRPALLAYCWLGATAVALTVIDVTHRRLPDLLVFPAYVVGVLALLSAGDLAAWRRAMLAMLVVFAVLLGLRLASPAGLGFGDVKLGGVLGLHLGWLGWSQVLDGILGGFVLGALIALALLAFRRISLRTALPLGPALLAASLLTVLTTPFP